MQFALYFQKVLIFLLKLTSVWKKRTFLVHPYVHINTSILAPQRSGGASMRSGGKQREDRSLRGLDDAVKTE